MNPFYRCAAVCLLALSGCKVGYFHAETKLLPDGSIERAILQPGFATPEEAQESSAWEKVGWTHERSFADFSGGIRDIELSENGKDYFAAWTKVDSESELPDHYIKYAVDEDFSSHFERQFERRDYGLVIEYSWQEKLTDVVTLNDFRKARQELIDLLCEVAEATLADSLGEEHDTKKLTDWLRNEGAAFAIDATDVLYDLASSKVRPISDDAAGEAFKQRIIQLSREHGFEEMFDESGKFQDKAVLKMANELIETTVSRRDGKPRDDGVVKGIIGAAGLSNEYNKSTVARKLRQSWVGVIEERYGGQKAFEKQVTKLGTRIQGVHGGLISGSPEQFRFVMDFPGVVVETSGVLLSENRVRWQFSGVDAWPSGFSMTGRSLLDNSTGMDELKQWRNSLSRESVTMYLDLVAGDQRMIDVMQKCRKARDLSPLEDFIETSGDATVAAAARKVLRLLQHDDAASGQ
jgi:hypothetical protein